MRHTVGGKTAGLDLSMVLRDYTNICKNYKNPLFMIVML